MYSLKESKLMKTSELKKALECAVEAAQGAGALMRKNKTAVKKINYACQHDIKLDLDVRCQKLIEQYVLKAFPETAVLGEEGVLGDSNSEYRWVIDPIDGTVNYAYGIPHACVSIALQQVAKSKKPQSILGVVYDPFCDELWTAIRGETSRLNGKKIAVSKRPRLEESIIAIGFAKEGQNVKANLPVFNDLLPRVRKMRMMGSAALALTYVASGRFDGYVEMGVRLWDIAAGGLIVECAGGEFLSEEFGEDHSYRMVASNGVIGKKLKSITKASGVEWGS